MRHACLGVSLLGRMLPLRFAESLEKHVVTTSGPSQIYKQSWFERSQGLKKLYALQLFEKYDERGNDRLNESE